MRAIKYRTKWAYGPSLWEWRLVPASCSRAEAADLMREQAQEYDWSDQFRGMEWVLTDKIPKKVLEEKLEAAENMEKVASTRVKKIREALAKL